MTTYGDLPVELHQAISQAAFDNRTTFALRGLDRKTRAEPPASQPFLDRLAKLLQWLKVNDIRWVRVAVKVITWNQEYRIVYVPYLNTYNITAWDITTELSRMSKQIDEMSAEQVLTYMGHVSGNARHITVKEWTGNGSFGYDGHAPTEPLYKSPDFGLEYAAYLV